jgi:hypothetical protein
MKISIETSKVERVPFSGTTFHGKMTPVCYPSPEEISAIMALMMCLEERLHRAKDWIEVVQVRFQQADRTGLWVACVKVVIVEPSSDQKIEVGYELCAARVMSEEFSMRDIRELGRKIIKALRERKEKLLTSAYNINTALEAIDLS